MYKLSVILSIKTTAEMQLIKGLSELDEFMTKLNTNIYLVYQCLSVLQAICVYQNIINFWMLEMVALPSSWLGTKLVFLQPNLLTWSSPLKPSLKNEHLGFKTSLINLAFLKWFILMVWFN